MQFHHHGYVSADRACRTPPVSAPRALRRPSDQIDVLIVGSGPAGMLLAAQMAQYPGISTRIIEKRDGRLPLGQADGIQPRSVETFQAFGFAERIIAEAYNIGWMNFWGPNPDKRDEIVRTSRTSDYAYDICEFPHLIVNQARVLDYFAEAAANGPGRIVPDYGVEFTGLTVHDTGEYPVEVGIRYVAWRARRRGEDHPRQVRRGVRRCPQRCAPGHRAHARGASAAHAWGVMDVLVNTDFPDWRTSAPSTRKRATSCTSRARRIPLAHVHRPRRGRGRRRSPGAADAHRGDHPSRQRDPAPVHARRARGRLAQRVRGRTPRHRRLRRL